jgi:hypothetical protein
MKTMLAAVALAIAFPALAQNAPAPANPHAHHQNGHGDHKPGTDHKAHMDGCMKSGMSKADCEKMCAEHRKGQGQHKPAAQGGADPHAGHDMSQHQGHPQG